MPDEFKSNDAIDSYRRYYASKAGRMAMLYYRGERKPPQWLTDLWSTDNLFQEHAA